MVSMLRMPPPIWIGSCGNRFAMAVTASPLTGVPAKAPLRSTRCSRRAPASTQRCAIDTGSSPYTVESSIRPWRKRTQLPSFKSIAGIISMEAIPNKWVEGGLYLAVPLQEVFQQLQASIAAFFRMELHREQIVARQRCIDVDAVACGRGDAVGLFAVHVVAVHEVEAAVLCNVAPQRMRAALMHLIPAHVRHLQLAATAIVQRIAKEFHATGKQRQAIDAAVFFAVLHQCLHADADRQ